jgi:PAS domain S-box-containing protein
MLTETEPERLPQDVAFWRQLEGSRVNEARLSLILEGVQDHAISMLDPSGAIQTWNSAAERIKGYRLDEVRGQHVRLLFTEQDRALGLPEAEIEIARSTGKYQGDGWRLRKDGTLFYASVSLSALRDESGQILGFVKVTHDTTDRLLAELLSDVSAALVAPGEDPLQVSARVAELLLRYFADLVVIELFDERAQLLSSHVTHRESNRELGLRALQVAQNGARRVLINLEGSGAAQALRRDGVSFFDAASFNATEQQMLPGLAPSRGLVLPLMARGRLVGVLALGRDQRPFDGREEQLGQELSRRLALAVDNARLLELAHAGERRLHLALEAGHMGAWEWDIAPNRVTWSPTLEDIHGIPRGSFAGTLEAYQSDMHPEDRERVLTALAALLRHGSTYHVNYRIVRPDGHTRWLDVHATLSRDASGAPQRLVGVCADVTERLLAQESLIASERRFRAVFDNALDAMLISSESDHVLDANPAACLLLGIPRDELLGRSMNDLVVAGTSPSSEPVPKSTPERGELQVRRGDGMALAVEHSTTPHIVPGQHFSVWRDVTSRRQFEASLAFLADASRVLTSTLDYRTALSSAVQLAVPRLADWATVDMLEPDGRLQPLAVNHVDPARVVLAQEVWRRWPTRAEQDFGVARVVRNGQSELVPEVQDSLLTQIFSEPDKLAAVRLLGMRSVMCVPLMVRDRALGAITLVAGESGRRFTARDLALAEDLGRRLAIAVENARLYDSEQQARRNADTANRAKDEFLATISHELRTPLNAMLGWTRILRSGSLDPAKQSKALETIERNAVTQAQLIEDLLDVSRIISGKLRLEFGSVELVHLVEQVVDSLRPTSEAKQVNVTCQLPAVPAMVLGDENRLQQVVWNLLSNAIKFTPADGQVTLRLEQRPAAFELSVTDTGSGIKSELLPLVFERFKQADSATTRAHGGLGLGLAITRHIVELHGGGIEVTSEGEGKGACFTIVFPTLETRGVVEAPAPESTRALSATPLRPEFVGLKVLVVDDDVDGRELVSAVLSDCGLTVITAADAPEALAKLKSERPDLLLSDIGLPGEDGYSLIRKVRALAHDEGADTPAAALTAYARIEDRRKALDAGYMMHVAKPVEPVELIAVVTNLLRFAAR